MTKRSPHLLIAAGVCFALALLLFFIAAVQAYAAPAPGESEPVKIEITANLESVSCFATRCAAAVNGYYHGSPVSGYLRGWNLKDGQTVTLTGLLYANGGIGRLRFK